MKKHSVYKTIVPITIGLLFLASCANQKDQGEVLIQPIEETLLPDDGDINLWKIESSQTNKNKLLSDYSLYSETLKVVDKNNDLLPSQFLSSQTYNNNMSEIIRKKWLKSLGYRKSWGLFAQEYPKLGNLPKDDEIECYAAIAQLPLAQNQQILSKQIIKSNEKLTQGCNELLTLATQNGWFEKKDVYRRIRILLSHNQVSNARNLANAFGTPLPEKIGTSDGSEIGQISLSYNIISPKNRNRSDIESYLNNIAPSLNKEILGFSRGIIGLSLARDLNMAAALSHFKKGDEHQYSHEQWEWFARSALRLSRWNELKDIIDSMPEKLKNDPTWEYWLGRSLQALNQKSKAIHHFEKAAQSGRNFYAILSHEELGKVLEVKNNIDNSTQEQINFISKDGNIKRALDLFYASLDNGDKQMRTAAQQEWRFAVRNYNEDMLLAASHLAHNNQFYEMAIYSADRTNHKLNYHLRYLSPFKDEVIQYAQKYGSDPAWIFGLIRQESRFMTVARSHVGASGLMQIMPATAKWIANKIGLDSYNVNNIHDNINMGVWYLNDILQSTGSEPMATAGYNAGPGRAKRWKQSGIEGAIYAETIPFNETRDYVKKVLTNAVYYDHLFSNKNKKLKQRLGVLY